MRTLIPRVPASFWCGKLKSDTKLKSGKYNKTNRGTSLDKGILSLKIYLKFEKSKNVNSHNQEPKPYVYIQLRLYTVVVVYINTMKTTFDFDFRKFVFIVLI